MPFFFFFWLSHVHAERKQPDSGEYYDRDVHVHKMNLCNPWSIDPVFDSYIKYSRLVGFHTALGMICIWTVLINIGVLD